MRVWLLCVSCSALLLAPAAIRAVTIHVPGDQSTIQAGIDAAFVGDTVLVAPGTYTGGGNRMISYWGKDVVVVSEEGPDVTVIDCGGEQFSPRAFYFTNGETSAAVLGGFTLTGSGNMYLLPWGGAVFIRYSSPTIRNCVFEENTAFNAPYGWGGGISLQDGSAPSIEGCLFVRNDAQDGAAVYSRDSSPTFTDCAFLQNVGGRGGSVYCTNSSPVFVGCDIKQNYATWWGGAMYCELGSSPMLTDCCLGGNHADGPGGAFYLVGDCAPVLVNCVVLRNSTCDGNGGGVYSHQSSPTFSGCTFFGNSGAEGIHASASDVTVTKSIIAFNTGQSIYCGSGSTVALTCCDIYGNHGGDWVGSCIHGQYGENGNFKADPAFCDTLASDLRLSSDSPCVIPQLDPECGDFIGALGVGCGATGVLEGRSVHSTWGSVKALYE